MSRSRAGRGPTDRRPLLLFAASGLAREVAEAARRGDREVLGFLDDDEGVHGSEPSPGLPVLGGAGVVHEHPGAAIVLCAGRGGSRLEMARRLAALGVERERYGNVIDPTVVLPPSAAVGRGLVLLAQVVLTADVVLGDHVVAMPHVVLTHDDRVSDGVTLGAGAVLGGAVRVGEAAYIGMGAGVRQGCRVGAGAVVGMGSVVLEDVPDGETWAGVPAVMLSHAG